jgi:hypothetical protein
MLPVLDTPRKKALAAVAGLLLLGASWSAWRGGPTGAVLILPVFYPFLLGHLPWLIVLPLMGIVAAMAWASWRARKRHTAAKVALAYLALAGALLLWGRCCETAKQRWVDWHMGGAGLQAGLNRSEVEATLNNRARVDECTPGGCSYTPRGLARHAFAIFEAYGVNTEYGPDGKLQRWQTWSD